MLWRNVLRNVSGLYVYDKTECNEPDMLPCKWMEQVGNANMPLFVDMQCCLLTMPQLFPGQIQCLKGHYCEEG